MLYIPSLLPTRAAGPLRAARGCLPQKGTRTVLSPPIRCRVDIHQPTSASSRPFSSTLRRTASEPSSPGPGTSTSTLPSFREVYKGPHSKTFRYLKVFSLSSLALSGALTPFIFILESSLPMSGRIFLAATAISTTTFSTYLISFFTGTYVNSITHQTSSDPAPRYTHTLTTSSMLLKPLYTRIVSPAALTASTRPLTTWELRSSADEGEVEEGQVLAWTEDEAGKVLGKWVMRATKEGESGFKGEAEGQVVRYFNVHGELLEGGI